MTARGRDDIDGVHPEVAVALRVRSGMERLRFAHETWELTSARLAAYLAARHPDWPPEEVRQAVARRMLDDPGRTPPPSR